MFTSRLRQALYLVCLPFFFLLVTACSEQSQSNHQLDDSTDVILVHNATIHTVDPNLPNAEAFAIRDERFIAVGDLAKLESEFPQAKILDASGGTIVPGFIDAHGHLLGLGESLIFADLMGTKSKQEIIDRLTTAEQNLQPGQWLLGRGWDQNDWPVQELPTAADLDLAFPDRPVWLERVDGHASWGNKQAIAAAKQNLNGNWQPEGGEIVRDKDLNPTGVFIDTAANFIQSQVPKRSAEELANALQLAMQKTASVGLTAMHDAGTSLEVWRLLQSAQRNGTLGVRVYAMADGARQMLDELCNAGSTIDSSAMLTARAIKLYSDGALGSRGAALLDDYSDDPGNRGLLIESQDALTRHATKAAGCGLQVNVHAIGDRGNRVTLEVLEAVADTQTDNRHRIEHSQVIAAADFEKFKELGLIASVQPTHATSDMYWAEDRVGGERILGAYAWQTFAKLGVPLALGSDFPVERPDPLEGFYAAITRQDAKAWPEGGWYPAHSLSREEALYGFTLGAAYAAFQESLLRSIEVGKFADFVILSKDIMTIPPGEILNTEIIATYLNGKEIYRQ